MDRFSLASPVGCIAISVVLGCSAGDPAPAGSPPGYGGTASGGAEGVGGATATGGASSMGGAAAELTPVPPAPSGAGYAFSSGDFRFEVDPNLGGRITVVSLGGVNLLAGPDVHSTNYGSTFWTDPQSVWNWPPPPEIDNAAYTASVTDTQLQLAGSVSSTLGVSVNKDFAAWTDGSINYVTVTYSIINQSGAQVDLGPWEVSRVPWGGVSFFMQAAAGTGSETPLPLQPAAGAQWLDVANAGLGSGQYKSYADGSGGWLAHWASGVLWVRKFADLPASSIAAGHGELELYAQPPDQYLELEIHGPYSPIAAGTALPWTVTWIVTLVPATVDPTLGSQSLVDFVNTLVAQSPL